MRKSSLSLLVALAAAVSAQAAHVKKVLVIGIDGCRVDALSEAHSPTLWNLARTGRFAPHAYAGGDLGKATQQPTVSGPGWSTILTGGWTDRHNVKDNAFKNTNLAPDKYPHFVVRLREAKPELKAASVVSWTAIDTFIVGPSRKSFAYTFAGDYEGDMHRPSDATVQEKLQARLTGNDDDVLFVHYGQCDGAGHKLGFGPKFPEYLVSLANIDKYVAEDLAAIRARKTAANEDWLILVTTDHGGKGRNHGAQNDECRTIFVIANGPGVAPAKVPEFVPQTVIAPTVADWFGIAPKPEWGWTKSFLK